MRSGSVGGSASAVVCASVVSAARVSTSGRGKEPRRQGRAPSPRLREPVACTGTTFVRTPAASAAACSVGAGRLGRDDRQRQGRGVHRRGLRPGHDPAGGRHRINRQNLICGVGGALHHSRGDARRVLHRGHGVPGRCLRERARDGREVAGDDRIGQSPGSGVSNGSARSRTAPRRPAPARRPAPSPPGPAGSPTPSRRRPAQPRSPVVPRLPPTGVRRLSRVRPPAQVRSRRWPGDTRTGTELVRRLSRRPGRGPARVPSTAPPRYRDRRSRPCATPSASGGACRHGLRRTPPTT